MKQKTFENRIIEKIETLSKIEASELNENIQYHNELLDRFDSGLMIMRMILLFAFLLLLSQCVKVS